MTAPATVRSHCSKNRSSCSTPTISTPGSFTTSTARTTSSEIFGKGGALEALIQAREQKMVRYLGVTGHSDPDVLMECLRRFDFDQILMALNAADPHHRSFQEKLLPMAVDKQMGIIGMKIPARGRILNSWQPDKSHDSGWNQPASKPGVLAMKEAMYFTLSLPVSTVIIGCDSIAQLEGKRATRARLHAAQRQPNGQPDRTHRAHRQAGTVLQKLGLRASLDSEPGSKKCKLACEQLLAP